MSYEKPTYYVVLRKKSRGYEVLYNIGDDNSEMTVIRLSGKSAVAIFKSIVSVLARQGAVVPLKISEQEQVYSIREDLGPVVGAYLILVRRARNVTKWSVFLEELVEGRYVGVAKAFSSFLELALELSRSMGGKTRRSSYVLSPVVADALSSALKRFIDKIARHTR